MMRFYADYAGIFSSFLCLIHCLLAPVILSFWLQVDTEHLIWIDVVFFLVSFWAVRGAVRQASFPIVKNLLWIGLSILGVSLMLEHLLEIFEYVALAAMVLLIGTHLFNLWYCRKCKHFTLNA